MVQVERASVGARFDTRLWRTTAVDDGHVFFLQIGYRTYADEGTRYAVGAKTNSEYHTQAFQHTREMQRIPFIPGTFYIKWAHVGLYHSNGIFTSRSTLTHV